MISSAPHPLAAAAAAAAAAIVGRVNKLVTILKPHRWELE